MSSAKCMGPAFRQWLGTGPGVAVADDVALAGSGQVAAFSPARWDHLLARVFVFSVGQVPGVLWHGVGACGRKAERSEPLPVVNR